MPMVGCSTAFLPKQRMGEYDECAHKFCLRLRRFSVRFLRLRRSSDRLCAYFMHLQLFCVCATEATLGHREAGGFWAARYESGSELWWKPVPLGKRFRFWPQRWPESGSKKRLFLIGILFRSYRYVMTVCSWPSANFGEKNEGRFAASPCGYNWMETIGTNWFWNAFRLQ